MPGSRPSSSVLNVRFPWASRSRSNLSSSLRSSNAGFRSMETVTLPPRFNASVTLPLRERMTGPERPKCVKSISPNASSFFFPSTRTLTFTLRMLRPCSRGATSPPVSRGINAGRTGTMECPADCARRYPSPVEPVAGYDTPPVAIITAPAGYVSPLESRTPETFRPSISRPSTVTSCRTFTPCLLIHPVRTSMTSLACPLAGNIRPPRSTMVGTPRSSKNTTRSSFEKR